MFNLIYYLQKVGCRILKVFSNICPQSSDRVVQCIGKANECMDAISDILVLIKEVPIKGSIQNYDPINFDDYLADKYGGFGGDGGNFNWNININNIVVRKAVMFKVHAIFVCVCAVLEKIINEKLYRKGYQYHSWCVFKSTFIRCSYGHFTIQHTYIYTLWLIPSKRCKKKNIAKQSGKN